MCYAIDIAQTSFVMLRANSTAGQARELLAFVQPTHLIVYSPEPQDTYYLLSEVETAVLLSGKPLDTPLADALRQARTQPCPVLDAYSDGETAPPRAVLIDDGHIVGLLDASVPPDVLEGMKGLPSFGLQEFSFVGASPRTPAPPTPEGETGSVSRSVVTEFPDRVRQGTVKTLKVALSASVETGPLVIARPLGTRILIVVEPQSGFELEGSEEGELIVTSEQQTMALRFKLRATTVGLGKIHVYAYEGVQPLGRMVVAATVVPLDEEEDAVLRERAHELASAGIEQPGSEPSVQVYQPDLVLRIMQKKPGPNVEFSMQLTAKDGELELEPFGLALNDPEDYFRHFFKSIEGVALDSAEHREEAELQLGTQGAGLFTNVFPEEVQTMLWDLRKRIKVVQIQSDEPWIPWEMCRFQGWEDGRWQTGPFLCESYQVTRWMRGYDAKLQLTLNNMALVVPKDSGLDYADKERSHLLSLAKGGRKVKPIVARFVPVYQALSSGVFDGWHFAGHGQARQEGYPDKSSIDLEDFRSLSPENLEGDARNLGNAKPLVFLNACQAGRGGMYLTDIGGFAAKFLWAGAGAFVGALWNVKDSVAYEFAVQFYDHLLGGKTLGQATQQSRLKIKEDNPGDPTWLAYTVYADPFATVQA